MTEPLIGVESVSKSFAGPDGGSVTVLDNITLEVGEGEFVALLGRSGSGKSTLLRCIAGLIAPTSGRVMFRGEVLTGTNRETTMVFQTFALLPWLTVQQNVELGLEARGVPAAERTERALRVIDIVGLDGYESAYPKELSGGMRQRVGFARALVVEPAALLMDEPFSALDVLTSENLRGELLELWEGKRFPTKTIVMVTHNIEEAVLLADRLLVLGTNPGRIKADMPNPLPRPRRRRTPEFEALVDQIYRMMTQRDRAPAAEPAPAETSPGIARLPQATVDGLSGLAEVLLGRHDGTADLPDLADNLGLEVDDLLPLVDALVLLGFASLEDEHLSLTAGGRVFAGASIQDSKEMFARASLERAPLVHTIFSALQGSREGSMPAGFFTDVMRNSMGKKAAGRQLDIAVNWGRYAELYDYNAARDEIIREDSGIGATLADLTVPGRRGTLHLYLGAAPGSGKTFTMLREGRALRDRGEDVVVGFVDTHGRPRTDEALGGLEIVPDRSGAMDLDAVLMRKPAVALVDDFGTYGLDISLLRDAGIDVISTVDVTDLGTTVAEADLAQADDIRFVDNSPEALRKRLGHGNIYPASEVPGALEGLFGTASLAALRETGLRVVADSLAPGTTRRPAPLDVLVAVSVGDDAGLLIQRGLRLARVGGATCTILNLGGLSEVLVPEDVKVLTADGKDVAADIVHAVRHTGARRLVLAAPAVKLADRWRPSLIERLADRLPDVHLHVIPNPLPGTALPASVPAARSRGTVRIYLGYAPGCAVTTAMLDEAQRRKSRGADVVVAVADCRDREDVQALLEGLDLIGDGSRLDTEAVLARRPEVVCIDDLSASDGGSDAARFAGARRIADAGITVVATVNVSSGSLDEPALLAFADEIQLVDVSPVMLGAPADSTPEHREEAFAIVAEHADRLVADSAEHPVILACAAPEPGLEPLIRRGAALAAQVAGDFLVAVVQPPELADRLKQVLAGYAALTEQLGGQFTLLQGAPATALADFARKRHVTELLLPRVGGASRHHMLRELVSRAGQAEVHLLPVARPS